MPETQGYKIVSISESDWNAAMLCVWKYAQAAHTNAALLGEPQLVAYWTAQAIAADALHKRMGAL